MVKKYRIRHDRDICIGCQACASVCPKYWKMDDKDGKSNIIVDLEKSTEKIKNLGEVKKVLGKEFIFAKKSGNSKEEVLGEKGKYLENDFELNKEAGENCPVNCIHIIDEDEKEII